MAKVVETAGTKAVRTSEIEATDPETEVQRQTGGAVAESIPPIISPHATPEEIDEAAEARAHKSGKKGRPKPLRFFPHIFPVPAQLYGIITIVAGTLLLGALFWGVRDVLSPFMLAVAAALLFFPFRTEPKIRPLIMAAVMVLLVWFVFRAFSILLPLVMAFILAYVIEPVVTKLQRKFYIKRWILALAATLMVFGLIVLSVGYLAPVIFAQIGSSLGALDRVADYLVEWTRDGGLTSLTGIPQEKAMAMIDVHVIPKIRGLDRMLLDEAGNAGAVLPGLLSGFYQFLMIPFVAFYFIKDYWHMRASIYSFIPQEYQRRSQNFLKDLDEVAGGYLRGDLITSVFQGLFVGVGLHFIGVPNALLLGVITGVLNLVPFIGGLIAFVLCALFGLATPDPGITTIYIALLFLVQGILEATVITPQVLGRHTDLHPLIVIFSLIVFGYFMGIVGMLIAIPVTGMILRNAMRWRDRRLAEVEQEKRDAELKENPHHATKAELAEMSEEGGEGEKVEEV
jgi:predicted PurR-regulated permease PerM